MSKFGQRWSINNQQRPNYGQKKGQCMAKMTRSGKKIGQKWLNVAESGQQPPKRRPTRCRHRPGGWPAAAPRPEVRLPLVVPEGGTVEAEPCNPQAAQPTLSLGVVNFFAITANAVFRPKMSQYLLIVCLCMSIDIFVFPQGAE